MTVRILRGDARALLPTLAAESVHCCVTSPPYYGLRDYGVAGQMGLEPTPEAYVSEMVALFREVRRALRPDGTLWLNLGDSYAGSRAPGSHTTTESRRRDDSPVPRSDVLVPGLKPKDLMMIPARVALALQADGWWIRKEIVWAKPNPMPESAHDRPTSAHEMVYLLTKSPAYFYDAEAIREADSGQDHPRTTLSQPEPSGGLRSANTGIRTATGRNGRGRNSRDVWTIATTPFPDAHFATFPAALPERCIRAGTSERGCCPRCGAPWRRVISKGAPDPEWQAACGADASGGYAGQSTKGHDAAGVQNASDVKRRILAGLGTRHTAGWAPSCTCDAGVPVPCTVLDPFGGAGTTGLVADRLGRDAVLIELNEGYAAMAASRCLRDAPLLAEVKEGTNG